MKHLLAPVSALCLFAVPALAQIDYANPTVETIVTRQQILDYTEPLGNTGIALRALAINNAGNLVITDRGGAQGEARLIEIDISGGTPVFSTIATEAEIAAVLETAVDEDEFGDPLPAPRLNFIGMAHAPGAGGSDLYYIGQFGQNPNNCATCADEVIEIAVDSVGTTTIRQVGSLDGINGVSYYDGHLYFPLIANFSNQIEDDGIYRMNTSLGNVDEIASFFDFLEVTDAFPGTQGSGTTTGPDGKVYFWSEEFRGGSDDLVTIDTLDQFNLAILEPKETFDPNFPGLSSIALDENNTLYAFDQFPTVAPRRFIIRESNGTLHFPDPQTIIDALGLTNQNQQFFPNDSLRAVVEGPGEVALYAVLADGFADVGNPRIIKLTFTDPNISEPGTLGDINDDGVVNVADVTELANIIAGAGTLPSLEVGDINDDGVVDVLDVQALAELIAD